VNDLIDGLVRLMNTPDDPRQRKPDISLAKSILNWEPTVEIKYGLEKTIDYFKRSG